LFAPYSLRTHGPCKYNKRKEKRALTHPHWKREKSLLVTSGLERKGGRGCFILTAPKKAPKGKDVHKASSRKGKRRGEKKRTTSRGGEEKKVLFHLSRD